MCWCRQYRAAEPPTLEEKQDIVDELHDALKKPDTVLKLKVPADEV
jgi:hypothetical protein